MAQKSIVPRHKLHDQLVSFYDERASSYDNESDASGHVWHAQLAQDLIKAASPYIPQNLKEPVKVLDLCCGTGMASFAAFEHFGDTTIVHGVDFSKRSIDIAKAKSRGRSNFSFIVASAGELEDIGLEKASYSMLICCSAFVLLPCNRDLLRLWAKYLAPNGVLVLDVTAAGTQQVTDFVSLSLPPGSAIVDRRWIKSEESLMELFEGSGLITRQVVLTQDYRTTAYDIREAKNVFDRIIQMDLYKSQVDSLSPDELETVKERFLQMIRKHARVDGVLVDRTQLYIGIASTSPST